MVRGTSIALAAGIAVAASAVPAQAQQATDARLQGVKLKSWTSKFDAWGGIIEVWELDRPERLLAWNTEPAAAIVLDSDQRFVVLDFALTRGPKALLDEHWMAQMIAAEGIDLNKRYGKACTAVSLMFRVKGQGAKQRKAIEAMGPAMAEPLGILSKAEYVDRRCESIDARIADGDEFEGMSATKAAEYKRALQAYQRALKAASARLNDKQRAKLHKMAMKLGQRVLWKSRLPKLTALLAENGARRKPIAFAMPDHVSFQVGHALTMLRALEGYDLVYPFVKRPKREKMPDDLEPDEMEKWMDRKRPPPTTVCVSLPFTILDASAWGSSTGTLLKVKWDAKKIEGAVTFDGEALDDPGAGGLSEALSEREGEPLPAARCDFPAKMHWSQAITMIAALRLAGAQKIVVRQTE